MSIFIYSSKETNNIGAIRFKDLVDHIGEDEFIEYVEVTSGLDYETLTQKEKDEFMIKYYEDDYYNMLWCFNDKHEALDHIEKMVNCRDAIIRDRLKNNTKLL